MSVRAVRPEGRYTSPDDVAALGQAMRGELLAWARRRFPAPWDHEEVLQEALTAAVLDPGVFGDEDHVRACLYSHFTSRLRNRFRDEHLRVVADAPLDADAVDRVADPDEAIDPPSRALHAWQRAVVEDLLAPYDETEQTVIRMRYRGGQRARKMDGVVSRKQCAQMLGLELAQVRSIEDRVIRRLDEQIAAYDRTCQRREREIELAARRAAGQDLSDDLLRRVEIGLRHLRVCGHCRHTFRAHRQRFATEIAVLVPLPLAIDHRSSNRPRASWRLSAGTTGSCSPTRCSTSSSRARGASRRPARSPCTSRSRSAPSIRRSGSCCATSDHGARRAVRHAQERSVPAPRAPTG